MLSHHPASMRKFLTLILACVAVSLSSIQAQAVTRKPASQRTGTFGLGAVIGEPTAITGKLHISQTEAIDGGFALAFDKWFLIYVDYLGHFPGAFGRANEFVSRLSPYIGVGGLMVFSNRNEAETRREKYFSESSSSKVAFGVRVPLGIEWRPAAVSVGVFVELVPGITIVPRTDGFFQGGIGARFYF